MARGRKIGFKCSDETKELMRQRKLGVKKSPEHVLHNSEAQKGNLIVKFPDGKRHRVYAQSYEDLLLEAQEKNWWLDKDELKIMWNELERRRIQER